MFDWNADTACRSAVEHARELAQLSRRRYLVGTIEQARTKPAYECVWQGEQQAGFRAAWVVTPEGEVLAVELERES